MPVQREGGPAGPRIAQRSKPKYARAKTDHDLNGRQQKNCKLIGCTPDPLTLNQCILDE
jgi:hypothetical protein